MFRQFHNHITFEEKTLRSIWRRSHDEKFTRECFICIDHVFHVDEKWLGLAVAAFAGHMQAMKLQAYTQKTLFFVEFKQDSIQAKILFKICSLQRCKRKVRIYFTQHVPDLTSVVRCVRSVRS